MSDKLELCFALILSERYTKSLFLYAYKIPFEVEMGVPVQIYNEGAPTLHRIMHTTSCDIKQA